MLTETPNLMSLDRASLEALFADMGEQRFRAKQVLQWIYQRRVVSFDRMTDLSKSLRQRLDSDTAIQLPAIDRCQVAGDGTVKWLLRLADGNGIEAVFIPETDRGTLCVSSQVGCGLNCTFCATARQGFSRNLTVDEIIGQVWVATQALTGELAERVDDHGQPAAPLGEGRSPITNVVMMGMGEPLLNLDNVAPAMRLMMDDYTFGLSRRRVTLSTAGMVPAMDRLRETCPVSLAVSLHAPNDELRNRLVPLNRKYPIAELLAACRRYVDSEKRQRITFEYVMLDGVNDTPAHARQLAALLGDVPAKVNLIPFNPYPGIEFARSPKPVIDRFRDLLLERGVFTVTRRTRGDDIDAACGQLAGQVQDRTNRSRRLSAKVGVPS